MSSRYLALLTSAALVLTVSPPSSSDQLSFTNAADKAISQSTVVPPSFATPDAWVDHQALGFLQSLPRRAISLHAIAATFAAALSIIQSWAVAHPRNLREAVLLLISGLLWTVLSQRDADLTPPRSKWIAAGDRVSGVLTRAASFSIYLHAIALSLLLDPDLAAWDLLATGTLVSSIMNWITWRSPSRTVRQEPATQQAPSHRGTWRKVLQSAAALSIFLAVLTVLAPDSWLVRYISPRPQDPKSKSFKDRSIPLEKITPLHAPRPGAMGQGGTDRHLQPFTVLPNGKRTPWGVKPQTLQHPPRLTLSPQLPRLAPLQKGINGKDYFPWVLPTSYSSPMSGTGLREVKNPMTEMTETEANSWEMCTTELWADVAGGEVRELLIEIGDASPGNIEIEVLLSRANGRMFSDRRNYWVAPGQPIVIPTPESAWVQRDRLSLPDNIWVTAISSELTQKPRSARVHFLGVRVKTEEANATPQRPVIPQPKPQVQLERPSLERLQQRLFLCAG